MTRLMTSLITGALLFGSGLTHAIESLAFNVVNTSNNIEVRRYAPHLLATVRVTGDFDDAGSVAFRPLFDFISGDNASKEKIAMTAPKSFRILGRGPAEAYELPSESSQALFLYRTNRTCSLDVERLSEQMKMQFRTPPPRLTEGAVAYL